MNNDIMQSIKLGTVDGFDLTLNALVEYTPYSDMCDDTPEQLAEINRKIDNYDYVYFCAQVTASKHGIELSSDYLACCLYDSLEDFVSSRDYIEDMKANVIAEAKQVIAKLAA